MIVVKRLIKSDILGMARVGYSGDLEVYVNTNDSSKIPHFHIRNPNNWQAFHSCILIESAQYFNHGNKVSVLNAQQRKELQHFMESPVALKKYVSLNLNNWQLICLLWDLNNSDVEIAEDITMPDYLMLPNL